MGAKTWSRRLKSIMRTLLLAKTPSLAAPPITMVALKKAPSTRLKRFPTPTLVSTGGVRVDGNGQLLTEDGVSIEGLYLAGEILGPTCISGNVIFGGINHAMAATWGLNAAENAAKAVE